MKHVVYSIFLFCCFLPVATSGQRFREATPWYNPGRLALYRTIGIKLYASDVLDKDEPVLNVGMEYFFGGKYGLEFSLGKGIMNKYIFFKAKGYTDESEVKQDYRVALEPRVYCFNRYRSRSFFGLTILYRKKDLDIVNAYYEAVQNEPVLRFASVHLNQDFYGFHLMAGRQFLIAGHLLIEGALGPGIFVFKNRFSQETGPRQSGGNIARDEFNLLAYEERNHIQSDGTGSYFIVQIKLGLTAP